MVNIVIYRIQFAVVLTQFLSYVKFFSKAPPLPLPKNCYHHTDDVWKWNSYFTVFWTVASGSYFWILRKEFQKDLSLFWGHSNTWPWLDSKLFYSWRWISIPNSPASTSWVLPGLASFFFMEIPMCKPAYGPIPYISSLPNNESNSVEFPFLPS